MSNVIQIIPLGPRDSLFYAQKQAARLGLHVISDGKQRMAICSIVPPGFHKVRSNFKCVPDQKVSHG